ncbi:MAG: transposase [Bacteroidetes bacterium]|nr:transposase [Bacteroidota bacterium]
MLDQIEGATSLIRGAKGRKIFLILDNLKVHHAKIVKAWLAGREHEIELFYLPSYSPELNPDEYLNCDLKAGVHSKPPIRDKNNLKAAVSSHMHKLQKTPERVAKYFQHPYIRYAARYARYYYAGLIYNQPLLRQPSEKLFWTGMITYRVQSASWRKKLICD